MNSLLNDLEICFHGKDLTGKFLHKNTMAVIQDVNGVKPSRCHTVISNHNKNQNLPKKDFDLNIR